MTSEQTIVYTSKRAQDANPYPIRRVGYKDSVTGKHYVFVTNQFIWSAQTIGYCRYLQAALAGGIIFQMDKTKLKNQDVSRSFKECCYVANYGNAMCLSITIVFIRSRRVIRKYFSYYK